MMVKALRAHATDRTGTRRPAASPEVSAGVAPRPTFHPRPLGELRASRDATQPRRDGSHATRPCSPTLREAFGRLRARRVAAARSFLTAAQKGVRR